MVENRAGELSAQARTDQLTPEFVLMGFSQYGLGLQLISDSLYIESKGLLAKPKLKLPPVHPNAPADMKEGLARLVGGLRDVGETHAYDQFLRGVSLRETSLGHIRAGIKFSEGIHNPFTRFRTLLSVGNRFRLRDPEAEEALARARNITSDIGPLHERVEAFAWSGWIDKQLGKDESVTFDAADIAFGQLVEQSKARFDREPSNATAQTVLRDVCIAGCTMAQMAVKLDRDPDLYLTTARVVASDITSWSEFVPSYIGIIKTEKELEQNHHLTLAKLKQKITVEDGRVSDSTIHFWLQVIDLEQSIGDDWQKTLEHVRGLCSKLNYPKEVAEGYAYLAEFEARNSLDPTEALKKAKKAVKQAGWYEKYRIRGAKGKIEGVEQFLSAQQLLTHDSEQGLPTEEELAVVTTVLNDGLAEVAKKIARYRNGDRRVEAYLTVASELVSIGLNPLELIDLAKYEVFGSSRPDSYAHRLKMLGRYQRSIGDSLHTTACNILVEATPQEMQQALFLAPHASNNYALIGFGAFIPRESHEQIIQAMDSSIQDRIRSSLSYGAVLTQ